MEETTGNADFVPKTLPPKAFGVEVRFENALGVVWRLPKGDDVVFVSVEVEPAPRVANGLVEGRAKAELVLVLPNTDVAAGAPNGESLG